MSEFLMNNLTGKRVTNQDGEKIGELSDITVQNDNTGDLSKLVIKPAENINPELRTTLQTDAAGNIVVNSENVESVKDYILVNTL